ncbi:MAG: UDP-N-acetylmuramate dehydrogenase [Alphaproteobacteria bacterium]|nr:MAG: UDP-N-acetylmuramate dehydrogenase [Alphaproteobacteria bacterium]
MSAAPHHPAAAPAWLRELPPLEGRITLGQPMERLSWLRVGGPAEVLYQPASIADLARFLAAVPPEVPVMPVGMGSNLIIRDGGLPGVVIRLGRGFNGVELLPGGRVRAGAAALDSRVAMAAARAGIDLGFLRTIPGAIGGAVRMNAGCYGRYTADVFERATAVTRQGEVITLRPADLGFGYRQTELPPDLVIVQAVLAGPERDPDAIEAEMAAQIARRDASQPVKELSCGSTFRNPAGRSSTGRPDDDHSLKAWRLIEDAGMKGVRLGGAQMSPKHANFLVNTGGARAAELEGLGEAVRKRVFQRSGIWLEWEIMRVGVPAPGEPTAEALAEALLAELDAGA